MIPFSTARLILRRQEESDAEPLMAVDADPEVMRYIGTGGGDPAGPGRALQAILRWRTRCDEQDFGYLLHRRPGNRPVHRVGHARAAVLLPEILSTVELGYRLTQHGNTGMPPRRPPDCRAWGSLKRDWTGSSASATSTTCSQSASKTNSGCGSSSRLRCRRLPTSLSQSTRSRAMRFTPITAAARVEPLPRRRRQACSPQAPGSGV
jgi:hypothetical protein